MGLVLKNEGKVVDWSATAQVVLRTQGEAQVVGGNGVDVKLRGGRAEKKLEKLRAWRSKVAREAGRFGVKSAAGDADLGMLKRKEGGV
jgi:hypothetical protein